MDPNIASLPPGDPNLVNFIVAELKSQGLFDQFRKNCLSDIDTKPACQNLSQRVEGYVANFLQSQQWRPDLNKNQLRDSLRRHINESGMLNMGVDRIVDQVVNTKVYHVFLQQIETVVYDLLGKELPRRSFLQRSLDKTGSSANPVVPGEEKKKEESAQESLQKIIGFSDESNSASNDKTENKKAEVKKEEISSPPNRASVETQTDTPVETKEIKTEKPDVKKFTEKPKKKEEKKIEKSKIDKGNFKHKNKEDGTLKVKEKKFEGEKKTKGERKVGDKNKLGGSAKLALGARSSDKGKSEQKNIKPKDQEKKSGDKKDIGDKEKEKEKLRKSEKKEVIKHKSDDGKVKSEKTKSGEKEKAGHNCISSNEHAMPNMVSEHSLTPFYKLQANAFVE